MRVPLSWLRDYVRLPDDVDVGELTRRLTMLGLKLDFLHHTGEDISGPLVVGGRTRRWLCAST